MTRLASLAWKATNKFRPNLREAGALTIRIPRLLEAGAVGDYCTRRPRNDRFKLMILRIILSSGKSSISVPRRLANARRLDSAIATG